MKKILFILTPISFVLFTGSSALAQTDSLLSLLNDLSENETYLVDLLLDLQENPVNLNEADRDELLILPLLTPEITDSIISTRTRLGHFKNKRQIRSITGPELYNLIKNYVTASQKKSYKLHLTHRNVYKIEKIQEIESGKFKGDALNDYTRLKYYYNSNLIVGFVTQKDVGEKNYLDHLNFSVHYNDRYWDILLGNFYLQMGEGLSHSNPFGNQKSAYISAVFRESSKIARANLSSTESSGKFGTFIQNNLTPAINLFSFYSNAPRDAQITNDVITGFRYDGYHRTDSELDAHNRFNEINWGAGIVYNINHSLKISTLVNKYQFSEVIENTASIVGDFQKRRQYFNFSGSELSQLGVTYSWSLENFLFSGEISSSDQGKPGWAQSVYYSKDKLSLGFKYWYLNNNFISVDGRVFDSSNPFPQGVEGFFAGATFKLNDNNSFSAFKLIEQQLWRSYFNRLPIAKNEWFAQWDYDLKRILFTTRFRSRSSEDFQTIDLKEERFEKNQNSIRLQLSYNPESKISTRTRWEHTYFENNSEKGTLFFQELNYMLNAKLSLNTRFTLFSTTSYDSRIYEYERDLPGTFSNVALSGNGNKLYFLIKWQLLQNFFLWFKWRYVAQDGLMSDGFSYKTLNRDLRLQLRTLF